MHRFVIVCAIAAVALGLVAAPVAAQTPKPQDTSASVPALDAMHEIIMPMWHEAWPNKDYKALAALVPAIDKHVAAIAKAELPGILRDKLTKWTTGVDDLKRAAAAYKEAVAAGNNEALLKAAESLHARYEALVGVIRPVLKEMDDFHAPLYVLYHYQMNPFQREKAADSIKALQAKMELLNKAVLPERLKAKADAFTAQRARLSKAVDAMVATLPGKDDVKIKEAIEVTHVEYEKLGKTLE
jgi:hypothetical protein